MGLHAVLGGRKPLATPPPRGSRDVVQGESERDDIEEDSLEDDVLEAGFEEEVPTIVADLRVKLAKARNRLREAEKRGDAWKSRAMNAEKLLRERVSKEHFGRCGWDDEELFSMDWWEEHPHQLVCLYKPSPLSCPVILENLEDTRKSFFQGPGFRRTRRDGRWVRSMGSV